MSSLTLALISSRAWVKCRGARVRFSGCLCTSEGGDEGGGLADSSSGDGEGVDLWVVGGGGCGDRNAAFSTSSRTQDKAAATATFLRSEPE